MFQPSGPHQCSADVWDKNCARSLVLWFEHYGIIEMLPHAWDARGGFLSFTFIPDITLQAETVLSTASYIKIYVRPLGNGI